MKVIGRTSETMEFRSKTDQLIDHADNFMGEKKRTNDEEEDKARGKQVTTCLKNTR